MHDIYHKFPQTERRHRVHPAVSTLAMEAQKATDEDRSISVNNMTVDLITKRCSLMARKNPLWPTILTSSTLAMEASNQPLTYRWWLPLPPPDQSSDDESMDEGLDGPVEDGLNLHFFKTFFVLIPMICKIEPPRRSSRITKGKAPIHADEIIPAVRGTKRPAEAVAVLTDDDDDGEDSRTPRNTAKANTRSNLQVVVQSPTHTRQKRRKHVGTAGGSAEVSSDTIEHISETLWVGTDVVRYIYIVRSSLINTSSS